MYRIQFHVVHFPKSAKKPEDSLSGHTYLECSDLVVDNR